MDLQNTDPFEVEAESINILLKGSNSSLGMSNNVDISSHAAHQLASANSFELNVGTSLSEDSGLPHTNSSISSGDSYRVGLCKFEYELAESDGDVSQFDSLDNSSDGGMSAENFNTLKKGPLAPIDPPPEFQDSPHTTLLRSPALHTFALRLTKTLISNAIKLYCGQENMIEHESTLHMHHLKPTTNDSKRVIHSENQLRIYEWYASDTFLNTKGQHIYDAPHSDTFDPIVKLNDYMAANDPPAILVTSKWPTTNHLQGLTQPLADSEICDYDIYYNKKSTNAENSQRRKPPIIYSPLRYHPGNNLSTINRPNSRNSLNSRLSSSHNSLSVPTTNKADDSIFITQAMSHDALTGCEISDFYNVPIDSDMYALPIDVIKPELKETKGSSYRNLRVKLKHIRNNKKSRKHSSDECPSSDKYGHKTKTVSGNDKRHSVPGHAIEPMHMTLDEVKQFYHSLYSSPTESNDVSKKITIHNKKNCANIIHTNNNNNNNIEKTPKAAISPIINRCESVKVNNHSVVHYKNKKISTKEECANNNEKYGSNNISSKKSQFSINLNLKQKFCSIFRFRKSLQQPNSSQDTDLCGEYNSSRLTTAGGKPERKVKFSTRALPPLPHKGVDIIDLKSTNEDKRTDETTMDFAANIEKVKEYGWYWGPISSEAAEKILSNEPDGSFIVRDSSDDHYIFSLTFKLNNSVRHVRIEQDQGTFSFGSCAKFKSHTIMEFIENAVESSRSGRYLFFFHRRPEHGPMRVQLTNPVSRFKHIQSLQHMCRFVIRKAVIRKDLILSLPLPRRLLDYLSYKNCYSEHVESDSSVTQTSDDGQNLADDDNEE